jgi:hypothetical protein
MSWNFSRRDAVVWSLDRHCWKGHMEKIVLLCLLVATISMLAELRAGRPPL